MIYDLKDGNKRKFLYSIAVSCYFCSNLNNRYTWTKYSHILNLLNLFILNICSLNFRMISSSLLLGWYLRIFKTFHIFKISTTEIEIRYVAISIPNARRHKTKAVCPNNYVSCLPHPPAAWADKTNHFWWLPYANKKNFKKKWKKTTKSKNKNPETQ